MKHLYIILNIFILSGIPAYTQTEFQFIGKLELGCDYLCVDPLGNFYVINDQNIKKYNVNLEKIGDYSNAYLGNISFADVSDPLRILIYYRDFNQVLWLDNFLQELRSPVKLDDIGIDQAVLLCSSNLGGFWVFDQLNNQLQYFDKNLRKIYESIRLAGLTGDTKPVSITEKNRMVFLYYPGSGILTFDQFATYNRTLPVFPDNSFQVTDENIYFLNKGIFKRYVLNTLREENLTIPDKDSVISVSVSSDYIFLHKKDGVFIYKSSSLYR